MEFSEVQKGINFDAPPLGAPTVLPNSQNPKIYSLDDRSSKPKTILGEVKAREHEIVRQGID